MQEDRTHPEPGVDAFQIPAAVLSQYGKRLQMTQKARAQLQAKQTKFGKVLADAPQPHGKPAPCAAGMQIADQPSRDVASTSGSAPSSTESMRAEQMDILRAMQASIDDTVQTAKQSPEATALQADLQRHADILRLEEPASMQAAAAHASPAVKQEGGAAAAPTASAAAAGVMAGAAAGTVASAAAGAASRAGVAAGAGPSAKRSAAVTPMPAAKKQSLPITIMSTPRSAVDLCTPALRVNLTTPSTNGDAAARDGAAAAVAQAAPSPAAPSPAAVDPPQLLRNDGEAQQ